MGDGGSVASDNSLVPPSGAELAAVIAAVEAVWPRPVAVVDDDHAPAWRFSGRRWDRPADDFGPRPWAG